MPTPQPTDEQLKRVLAKMLPERLFYGEAIVDESGGRILSLWDNHKQVKPTELLQIVWEIEETLTDVESEQYINLLENNMDTLHGYPNRWRLTHATWQQRTIALAAVKGIKL